jgi:two-component system nitrate/nitrite sensor histidine kinase NarX
MNNSRKRPSPEGRAGPYRSIFDAASDGLIITDSETGLVVEANSAACAMHGYAYEEFIGLLPAAFIHPEGQQAFRDYLRAFQSRPADETNVLHLRRDGSTFHAEWRGTAFTYQGRSCLLAVVRDVSRRIQADLSLQQGVEARTREQSALLEISHGLASTLELQPGLILEQLQGIVEYTHAGIFGVTDSTLTTLALRGPAHLEQPAAFQVRLQGPETLEALLNGHRPIRVADIHGTEPAAEFLRSLLATDGAMLLQGVRAWMWVPLAVKGRIIGGLGLAHTLQDYFTPHHAALALSMADQVAITMVNAELYEHAQALAALQERQRLARNLHDAVNQSLFSAGLIAEVLPRLWERDPEDARRSLEDLRRLTRGALAEMRELLAELRPSVLTDSSLADLLRQLAYAFTGRTNISASVTSAGEHALPADIQVVLYRICQEALNNIAKHARASRVEIDLQYESGAAPASSFLAHAASPEEIVVGSVEMRIRDDGRGFDPDRPAVSGHYGLDMMRERAEGVGAQLTVTSEPGRGTEVTVRWHAVPEQEAR